LEGLDYSENFESINQNKEFYYFEFTYNEDI